MNDTTHEPKQERGHKPHRKRTYGIFTKVFGYMPHWVALAFQVGALATGYLMLLVGVGLMITGIVTGNLEIAASLFSDLFKFIASLIPGSHLGGL